MRIISRDNKYLKKHTINFSYATNCQILKQFLAERHPTGYKTSYKDLSFQKM